MTKRLAWTCSILLATGLALGAGATVPPYAAAQAAEEQATSGTRVPPTADGGVQTHTRTVRPAPGLARGRLPVPGWVVLTAGSAVALAAAGVLLHRILRRRP